MCPATDSLRCRRVTSLYNNLNMDKAIVRMDTPVNLTNNLVGESTIQIGNIGCTRQGFTVDLRFSNRKSLPVIAGQLSDDKIISDALGVADESSDEDNLCDVLPAHRSVKEVAGALAVLEEVLL